MASGVETHHGLDEGAARRQRLAANAEEQVQDQFAWISHGHATNIKVNIATRQLL